MIDQEKAALAAVTLANKTLEESRLWWESLAHKNRADRLEVQIELMNWMLKYDKEVAAHEADVKVLRRELRDVNQSCNTTHSDLAGANTRLKQLQWKLDQEEERTFSKDSQIEGLEEGLGIARARNTVIAEELEHALKRVKNLMSNRDVWEGRARDFAGRIERAANPGCFVDYEIVGNLKSFAENVRQEVEEWGTNG